MKRLNLHRVRFVLAGSIAAIMMGGIKPANAATIEVGAGEGHDFATIQVGIDTASDGDTILVAPGEYIISEPITFRGKTITVKSKAGPNETTIRMGTPADPKRGSVVIFENSETEDSVLEGFTITGGRGTFLDDWAAGGILFHASSGTVRNCAIVQNTSKWGGGIYCGQPCSPSLIDCTIAENTAELAFGGGVFSDSGSSMSIINCVIRDNSATGSAYGTGVGGGVCCWNGSSTTMTHCAITGNSAGFTAGGVASGENASVNLTRCVMVGNTADRGVGGLETWMQGSATVINCVIAQNTISGWGVGGVVCSNQSSATLNNSILWGNTAPNGREIWATELGTLSISYSNVAGGLAKATIEGGTINWGAGNIDADPLFVQPGYWADVNDPNVVVEPDDPNAIWIDGDYHLKSAAGRWDPNSESWVVDDVTSPCIDAGDPNSSLAFEPYPNGAIINMGAYGGTAEASKSPSGLHAKYSRGSGTEDDPYQIATAEDLMLLGESVEEYDKHFILTADIDLDPNLPRRKVFERAVIAPDVDGSTYSPWGEPLFDGIPFSGVFDGNGHTIFHLTIEGESYLGLFGQLDSGAMVTNLGLESVYVNGAGDYVGGLVGLNYDTGSITASYSTGTVSGGGTVGGLVGENYEGTITTSYSTCSVSGGRHVGGLVGGNNEGSITSSYSMGTVTGESAAGLVCTNFRGWITMCYSTSAVTGRDRVVSGPLFGISWGGTFTSCFWDMETSGWGGSVGRTGLTTAEMQTAHTFLEAGWDFIGETENGTDDIWWIDEGQDYPRLWWELIPEN